MLTKKYADSNIPINVAATVTNDELIMTKGK